MADQTIEILLKTIAELGGAKQVQNELNSVRKSFGDAEVSSASFSSGLKSGLLGVARAIAPVAAGAVLLKESFDFLKGSFSEALEAEQSLQKLEFSLLATNEATKENISSFSDFADQLQATTKYNDDLVISQIAAAKNFGLSNEQAKNLVATAADLATVTGTDLGHATDVLLKSLTGQLPRELKLLGLDFTKLTEEQLKASGASDLVAKKFGSAAENEVKTNAGAIAQLSNSYKQLQESVGVFLVDVIKLPTILSSVTSGVQTLIEGFKALTTPKTNVQELTDALEAVTTQIQNLGNANPGETSKLVAYQDRIIAQLAEINKGNQEVAASAATVAAANAEAAKNSPFEVDQGKVSKFLDDIKKVGLTVIDAARQEKNERLKLLNEAFGGEANLNRLSAENKKLYADAKFRIEKDLIDKVKKERDKDAKDEADKTLKRLQTFNEAKNNIGQGFVEAARTGNTSAAAGSLLGVGQAITQGEGGARSLITAGTQGAGFALGGEAGGAVGAAIGPILQELSKGKEAAKAFVTEFLQSIPDMILGLVDGIVAAAVAFVEQVPAIVQKFIEGIPVVIENLANAMPQVAVALSTLMPQVAVTFAVSLIEQAPAIAQAIVKAIGNAPGNAVKGVGKIFKFAEGGQMFAKSVPGGYNNDTFPARLTSGELVVDRSTAYKLKDFLDGKGVSSNYKNEQSPQSNNDSVMAALSAPIVVNIDGREVGRAVRRQVSSGLVLGV